MTTLLPCTVTAVRSHAHHVVVVLLVYSRLQGDGVGHRTSGGVRLSGPYGPNHATQATPMGPHGHHTHTRTRWVEACAVHVAWGV